MKKMAVRSTYINRRNRFYGFHQYLQLLLLLVFAIPAQISAQVSCAAKLREAEKSYENGQISEIPTALSECMKKGFTEEEKVRAYKIIINSHLFNEDLEQAGETMLKFLRFNPEFKPDTAVDQADFINLYDKFETLPSYSIGFFAGSNISSISTTTSFDLSSSRGNYQYAGLGFQFGARYSKTVHPSIDINAELGISFSRYNYVNTTYDFTRTTLNERQYNILLPVSATYSYEINKIRPFATIGLQGTYMVAASVTPLREYIDNSHQNIEGTDLEMINNRNRMNASVFAGLGARYKIPHGYFFMEARYNLGLFNQTVEKNRYDTPELNYIYYYADDRFKLNNITFSVGYMYMIYKPKRKNHK